MSCIIGYVDGGKTYIASDSAAINDQSLSSRTSVDKVFPKGNMIFGVAGSFRIGQILRYNFIQPEHPENMNDMEYLCSVFVDSMIECFKQYGSGAQNENEILFDGSIIISYRGKIYNIEEDFSVFEGNKFMATGCGEDYALAALYALENSTCADDIITKIHIAMKASYQYSIGVRPPFYCYVSNSKDFEIFEMK